MASLDHARALYDEVAEHTEGSVDVLKHALMERAKAVREGISEGTRTATADVLEHSSPEDLDATADALEQSAGDLEKTLGQHAPTLTKLGGDIAGEARLGANEIRIDPRKITGDETIIDVQMAEDVLAHEREHTRQSAVADAEGITIGMQQFDAREIREAAAISVQKDIRFLSDEYRSIAQRLTMDASDREFVRKGQFKALERRKSGYALGA